MHSEISYNGKKYKSCRFRTDISNQKLKLYKRRNICFLVHVYTIIILHVSYTCSIFYHLHVFLFMNRLLSWSSNFQVSHVIPYESKTKKTKQLSFNYSLIVDFLKFVDFAKSRFIRIILRIVDFIFYFARSRLFGDFRQQSFYFLNDNECIVGRIQIDSVNKIVRTLILWNR